MSDRQDFLVVELGAAAYALPASAVDAAVAPGIVTPLPFVPAHVEGLIKVNERVLPLIDLRRLPGIAAAASAGGGELVVVETTRSPCALRVDRIVGRVELNAGALQSLPSASDAAEHESAAGLVDARFDWKDRTVLVLSLDVLGKQLTARLLPDGRRGLLGRLQQDSQQQQQETFSCLALRTAGERYALRLTDAIEILDLPPATAIPGAPDLIEGIALVRHEALLVLSLSRLLKRGAATGSSQHVVVIDRGGTRYGMRVDVVDGIVACSPDALRRVEDESSEVSGVIIHEQQVLGMLEASRLLPAERHALLLPFVPAQRNAAQERAQAFSAILEISLGTEHYGIPLSMVRRIADHATAERIAAPDDSLVSGAVNIDGQVVPVVDFAALLQLPDDTGRHRVWILIGDEHREWAVPAREARRIVDIPVDAIDEVGHARGGLVSGIATVDDRLLPLLGTRLLLEAT